MLLPVRGATALSPPPHLLCLPTVLPPPLPPPPLPQASFKYVDDLATLWCEWAEMELRHKNFKRALELMRRATHRPGRPRSREVRGVPWRSVLCGVVFAPRPDQQLLLLHGRSLCSCSGLCAAQQNLNRHCPALL